MANLTLAIDDELLHQARLVALEQRTTVNALVRRYLEEIVAAREGEPPLGRFVELSRTVHAGGDEPDRAFDRASLYDRR